MSEARELLAVMRDIRGVSRQPDLIDALNVLARARARPNFKKAVGAEVEEWTRVWRQAPQAMQSVCAATTASLSCIGWIDR